MCTTQHTAGTMLPKPGQYLPLHVNRRSKNFGCFRGALPYSSQDIFSFQFQLVYEVVHLLPLSTKFQGFTGTRGPKEKV